MDGQEIMKTKPRLRDSRGRFVKEAEDTQLLRRYGQEAAGRLRAIADDPDTPVKLRAEIERFFFESVYGKGGRQPESEPAAPAVLRFEGVLEEWSR